MVLIGYARCSTPEQDLAAQRQQLENLGVTTDRIYYDHGRTGKHLNRPGLDQALAAVREGDTFVVTKLDRLARSVNDALTLAESLNSRGVALSVAGQSYAADDPQGRLWLSMMASFAEFERNLISQRTKEGMAAAKADGRLTGRNPKLSTQQQQALLDMYQTGKYNISQLAEIFKVSRPTIYRTLDLHNINPRNLNKTP